MTWLRAQWALASLASRAMLGGLIALLLLLLYFAGCRADPPQIPASIKAREDSIHATARPFADSQRHLRDSARVALTTGAVQQAHSRALNATATATGTRATALQGRASAPRTAAASHAASGDFRAAYAARTEENAILRDVIAMKDSVIAQKDSVIAQKDRAFRDVVHAAALLARAEAADSARLVVVTAQLDSVYRVAEAQAKGCRILRFIPCASPTQTAIVGLVAGAVAEHYVAASLSSRKD